MAAQSSGIVNWRLDIGSQCILEARHGIGTTPPRYPLVTHILGPQAINERIKQFVLQGHSLWLPE